LIFSFSCFFFCGFVVAWCGGRLLQCWWSGGCVTGVVFDCVALVALRLLGNKHHHNGRSDLSAGVRYKMAFDCSKESLTTTGFAAYEELPLAVCAASGSGCRHNSTSENVCGVCSTFAHHRITLTYRFLSEFGPCWRSGWATPQTILPSPESAKRSGTQALLRTGVPAEIHCEIYVRIRQRNMRGGTK
jgi:hypothetical protein